MRKRIMIILLCLVMVASVFAGCNKGNDPEKPGTSPDSQGTKTLKLWSIATQSDAFSNSYQKAIADFENANKGVKIEHNTFENQSYKTKIKSAVGANDLPDIFYTWGGGFSKPFVATGKVLEVDKYYADYKDQLPQVALSYATYDGKLYGSTYTTPISVLFYNKKLLEANGLQAPTTFDELVAACKTLKEKGVTPIGISGKDVWVLAMTHDALTMKSAGPEKTKSALQKAGQSYNDPDFLAASTKFKELIDMGAFQKGSSGMVNDVVKQQFLTG